MKDLNIKETIIIRHIREFWFGLICITIGLILFSVVNLNTQNYYLEHEECNLIKSEVFCTNENDWLLVEDNSLSVKGRCDKE